MSTRSNSTGRAAADILSTAVELRWFAAAPRVNHWRDTLAAAYAAHHTGHPDRLIDLPRDVQGMRRDTAAHILGAFDSWLGRGVVFDSYVAATEGRTGVDLAVERGW